jgi:hypothetical protein
VPPYLRVVEASACENSWNSLPICSAVRPMPVSVTATVIQSCPSSRGDCAAIVTVPLSVNLFALLAKLRTHFSGSLLHEKIAEPPQEFHQDKVQANTGFECTELAPTSPSDRANPVSYPIGCVMIRSLPARAGRLYAL